MGVRVESFTIGDFVHVYNRGNRKMPIVRDEADKWRFLKILRYFNDINYSQNVLRGIKHFMSVSDTDITDIKPGKPKKPRKPLVKILSYCLMPNHFHLLLKEIIEGGIAKFMHKLGIGYTNYFNIKHEETGRLFQGAYKGRTAEYDKQLEYLDAYIQVLNPLELYPGGLEKALKEFDKAFEFAIEYPFCSLGETFRRRKLGIIDRDILKDISNNLEDYKGFCYEALVIHDSHEILKGLLIE